MISFYTSMVETEAEKELVEFLYKEYSQIMFKTAYSILHNQTDAEDAVHCAFVRIIGNLKIFSKYTCNENISYLVIVVRGIALDMLRKSKRTELLADGEISSDVDVEKAVETACDYETVLNNIKLLSPALKNVATLYFVNCLSEKEIAKLLDMNINTVRSSISRARAILKKRKEEQNI